MKKLLFTLVVFATILFGIMKFAVPGYESVARLRVANMLKGMHEGSGTDGKIEMAMAMWAENKLRIMDRDRLSWASDNFDRWRTKKNLYRQIGEYKIDSVEEQKGTEEPTALVAFTIEGMPYKVLVPKDHAIQWVD
ncbi:MAG TPA: hypothetical protein VN181_08215 [Thermoanaerobaculia bacterium]|nr:hypothetical protein [Thermoanaerobaculia bacterium]